MHFFSTNNQQNQVVHIYVKMLFTSTLMGLGLRYYGNILLCKTFQVGLDSEPGKILWPTLYQQWLRPKQTATNTDTW